MLKVLESRAQTNLVDSDFHGSFGRHQWMPWPCPRKGLLPRNILYIAYCIHTLSRGGIYCIRTLSRGVIYLDVYSRQPRYFLLPTRVEANLGVNTSRLKAVHGHSLIINLSLQMCQEIHPCKTYSINSVKINTSLAMVRECIVAWLDLWVITFYVHQQRTFF